MGDVQVRIGAKREIGRDVDCNGGFLGAKRQVAPGRNYARFPDSSLSAYRLSQSPATGSDIPPS